jgi:hypothetical protein
LTFVFRANIIKKVTTKNLKMRNSSLIGGPYHNGVKPRRFLNDLTIYYNTKKMTSNGGKKYNLQYGC